MYNKQRERENAQLRVVKEYKNYHSIRVNVKLLSICLYQMCIFGISKLSGFYPVENIEVANQHKKNTTTVQHTYEELLGY
jgi:hypothetical protein